MFNTESICVKEKRGESLCVCVRQIKIYFEVCSQNRMSPMSFYYKQEKCFSFCEEDKKGWLLHVFLPVFYDLEKEQFFQRLYSESK
jgi:hypothetical protein